MDTIPYRSNRRGWTLIQRRLDGSIGFDRGMQDYLNGFGYPSGEHWIGLTNIRAITIQRNVAFFGKAVRPAIRIDLEDWDGIKNFIEHESFTISPGISGFHIHLLGVRYGMLGMDVLGGEIATDFSTQDRRTGYCRGKWCVGSRTGGWWFGSRLASNLNGVYQKQNETMKHTHMHIKHWDKINPRNAALRFVSIKLQLPRKRV